MMQILKTLLQLLSLPFVVVMSCACNKEHPQTIICNTDWAFLGKVTDSMNVLVNDGNTERQRHTVHVYKVIKGESKKLQDQEKVIVFSPNVNDSCKIDIITDMKAVFTGMLNTADELEMNKCSWYEKYEDVPRCQRRSLFKKLYKDNCNCKIQVCSSGDCKKSSPNECVWNVSKTPECHEEFSHCAHYSDCGICAWKRCRNFYDCEDGKLPEKIPSRS